MRRTRRSISSSTGPSYWRNRRWPEKRLLISSAEWSAVAKLAEAVEVVSTLIAVRTPIVARAKFMLPAMAACDCEERECGNDDEKEAFHMGTSLPGFVTDTTRTHSRRVPSAGTNGFKGSRLRERKNASGASVLHASDIGRRDFPSVPFPIANIRAEDDPNVQAPTRNGRPANPSNRRSIRIRVREPLRNIRLVTEGEACSRNIRLRMRLRIRGWSGRGRWSVQSLKEPLALDASSRPPAC